MGEKTDKHPNILVNASPQTETISNPRYPTHLLHNLVEGTASTTGDGFFRSLVRNVATALRVKYAFVAELNGEGSRVRTLAFWSGADFVDNLEFDIAGTPCERVLGGEMRHYPDSVQTRFPKDKELVELRAESYLAIPFMQSGGQVLGHLVVLDDKPMPVNPPELSIFHIFAARAEAELARKRMEEALRASEERYRDLYQEAPNAYLSVGPNARILKSNRSATELLGYTAEELVGRPVFDLYADTPDGLPKAQVVFQRFLDGRETLGQDVELRRADGGQAWVNLSVRPILNDKGEIVATRSILVDITERKRAESALKESEDRLARILESAIDAVITIDGAGCVNLFNASAERMFGCCAYTAIGKPLDRFLSEPFRNLLSEYAQATDPSKATRRKRWIPEGLTARRVDGETFSVEGTISPVKVCGRTLYTLILRDIDERKRAEAKIIQLQRDNLYLKEELKSEHSFEEIIGTSSGIREIVQDIQRVAPTNATVLITGETGTGKELVARALHNLSHRRNRPLIKVNCTALPIGLIESELFGHEKGAFTGAVNRRIGRFELADGATIFLDELGEIPLEIQVKLLRVLQEQEFERVGGAKTNRVDVRVIAATNRELKKAIKAGEFREDLYYRLNVIPLHLPPLRERKEDIQLLVRYLVKKYMTQIGKHIAKISQATMERLTAYPWPGNIRELEHLIERAVIFSTGSTLEITDALLPRSTLQGLKQTELLTLKELEWAHIMKTLERTGWVIEGPRGAAKILDLHPNTLRGRMRKLDIRREPLAS